MEKRTILKGKVIQILQTFSRKELKRFVNYVHSPFFNKKDSLIRFLNFIVKYHPEFTLPKFSYETAYRYVFGKNTPYEKRKIYVCKTELNHLLKDFLVFQQIQKEDRIKQALYLRTFEERTLEDLFKREVQESLSINDKVPRKNIQDFQEFYQLTTFSLLVEDDFKQQQQIQQLRNITTNLDQYYLLEKLYCTCDLLMKEANVDKEKTLIKNLLAYMPNDYLEEIPIIKIYHQLYLLLAEEAEEQYTIVKNLLLAIEKEIDHKTLRPIFKGVLTYCIRQSNKGEQRYLLEIFDWYVFALDIRLLWDKEYILAEYFGNIVNMALLLRRFDWAANFVKQYKDDLKPVYKEYMVNYSLAEICFCQHQYEQTLEHLSMIQKGLTNIQHIKIERLLAITFFELKYMEALHAKIHVIESYLSRKRKDVPPATLIGFRNFIMILKRLIHKMENPNYKRSTADITKEIGEMELLFGRRWLLYQLERLGGD